MKPDSPLDAAAEQSAVGDRHSVATPHAVAQQDLLMQLEVDGTSGLGNAEVERRRQWFGYNELRSAPPIPWWFKFFAQFKELVVLILIAAAIISGATGDWTDAVVILAIVVLNGVIGFLQEEKAERALAGLKKLSAPTAKVLRDGVLSAVPARDLVPGDRIAIEASDSIPADARIIEAYSLRVQESALTGESSPSEKEAGVVLPAATALGDRRNMLFQSTVVVAGKAQAVVTATGMQTELGRIAGLLQEVRPEPTPLQRRLAELGRILVFVCLGIVAIVFSLELYRGGKLSEVFIRSISLAVAAVPEGLPAVVTMALALGLTRMVRRNVLIRRLPSVETLGSVTVVCSDKTGTLTRNEMTVRVVVAGGEWFGVTGTGYAPEGRFVRADERKSDAADALPVDVNAAPDLVWALNVGMKCNAARMSAAVEGQDGWQVIGDPTEGALLVAAMKAGLQQPGPDEPPVHEIPFDSERKAMSVVHREQDGQFVMYTKGAAEVILPNCIAERHGGQVVPLTNERRDEINRAGSQLAAQALRVLALAYREHADPDPENFVERDLIFAGLAGMIDPPRDEVKVAIEHCRAAGIRPVMITGDHPETATAIARELNLAGREDRTVTGGDLNQLTDEQLARDVDQIAVYARVSPEHKLRVVRAWRSRGQVVAMTGDGVNDAPAVQTADIGIAMGITGTDVTKDASDMVLTDDNFTSIVSAIEEGRGIFDNIQKFIHYLLSCNSGEVLLMFFAALVAWPAPLEAIQILWINLVTDGLPALALAMEPPERDIMQRPPRPPHENVVTLRRGLLMLVHGTLIAAAAGIGFAVVSHDPGDHALERARMVAFSIMSFSQLFFAIGCRSQQRTLFELGAFSNPHLLGAILISGLLQLAVLTVPFAQAIFHSATPTGQEWLIIAGLSLAPVTIIEVTKLALAAARR